MDYKNLEMLAWIAGELKRAGKNGITYDELIDHLYKEPSVERSLTQRTFHNYLAELRGRFGLSIVCDRKLEHDPRRKSLAEENRRYRYRLEEGEKVGSISWETPFLWLLGTADALKQVRDSDASFVQIDCREPGVENVAILLEAIRQRSIVSFTYKNPVGDYLIATRVPGFQPRRLLMKNLVWYLFGDYPEGKTKDIYMLSDLSDIQLTEKEFEDDPDFSVERCMEESHIGKKWKRFVL